MLLRHWLVFLVALAALSCEAAAQEVGKASAVNPAATANLRTITIGSSITHKERIKTAAEGSVQILFVDKTSMTIGPNSDLTIDEYVYDPNAGTGKLAATLGKGALRFVGGQISHSGDAEIKTANAVIGIRGGVALISPQNVYTGYGGLDGDFRRRQRHARSGRIHPDRGRAVAVAARSAATGFCRQPDPEFPELRWTDRWRTARCRIAGQRGARRIPRHR